MESQHPLFPELITPADWENTPSTVKHLIEALQAHPQGHEILAAIAEQEVMRTPPQGDKQQQLPFQESLQSNCQRYQEVLQTQTDLILRSLPDTTITFANDAVCLALGRPLEAILGWRWSHFMPPDYTQGVHQKIAELTSENPSFENINQDYRSDHQIGWTQWINLGIFNNQGELVEIQSVGRDVTKLQNKIHREQAINRVSHAIRNSLDLSTIFTTAATETAHLLKPLDCFVVKYLAEEGLWRHIAEFHHDVTTPSTIGLGIPDAKNPFANLLKQFQVVRIEDTKTLQDEINLEIAQILPGAWLMIPLVIENKLWGSFTLVSIMNPLRWSDDQVELAQAVAAQLEIAIQQANLYHQIHLELEERRRFEEALRASENRFQKMADNVPGVIFGYCLCIDGSEKFTYISSGFRDLYGFEPDGALDDASIVWRMTHPDDIELLRHSVMVSFQSLQTWQCQYRVITPNGVLKWVQGISRPTRTENGDVIWDGLIIDISQEKAALEEREQAEIALTQSEQRFRSLFESTPKIAVQGYNRNRQVIYWNYASEKLYGYTKKEAMGRYLEDLIIPLDMRQEVINSISKWLLEGQAIPAGELILTNKDGGRVSVYSSHILLTNSEGEIEFYCVDIDLSERHQAEAALRDSEARYRLVAENINDLVCLHDPDGRYLYVTPSSESLLGYQSAEMLGQNPYDFFHPDDRERIFAEAHQAALSGKPAAITYRMRHKSGSYIWFETLTKPIKDTLGNIIQLQTTSRDVTERIEAQNQLKHFALHDALTGLPNRHLLMERIELAINRAKRLETYSFAVLFLDLDRFKVINDSLGHIVGDQLLVAIAERLQSSLRGIDLAARIGGDEFVVLLEEIRDIKEAIRATERIFSALKTPIKIENKDIYTTFSIGVVLGEDQYTHASQILRDADIAMYRAKMGGKARYEIFDMDMHIKAINRLHLENDLRSAIENQEFVLYYQPIINLDLGCLVGLEALIRWQHPTDGLKYPGDFIGLAEEIGLITAIDYWALKTACQQLANWKSMFPHHQNLNISVNISAQDFRHSDLLEVIEDTISQSKLDSCFLILEITESMLIQDMKIAIGAIEKLKKINIEISIDDFGSGFSSLNYLHLLPVNNLKVDRSFISQIELQTRGHQIIEAIMALSKQLNLNIVAEGIETHEQLIRLQQLGYRFGQGYLFSKPLNVEAAEALLRIQHLSLLPTVATIIQDSSEEST